MSGIAFALVAQIPGNVLKGNWKVVVYMSSKAKPAQKQAILNAWTGKLGGPLADIAKLVGEVKGVYDVPIQFKLNKGKGTIKIGDKVEAAMAPYVDAKGNPTTLSNTIFTHHSRVRPRTWPRRPTTRFTSRSTGWSGPS